MVDVRSGEIQEEGLVILRLTVCSQPFDSLLRDRGAQHLVLIKLVGTGSPGPSSRVVLVVRDASALKVLSRLIRTEPMLSLRLPQCSLESTHGATLCSGTAWMERAPGDHERGYLVALRPGCLMDVYVDTDAEGQNALGVVEIDSEGQMTGSTLSFNNLVEGDVRLTQRRTGSIGNYSVYNDGHHTKFYLFAGSHLLTGSDGEGMWHQSDYRVLHDSNHSLVIGWDDSGCTVVDEPHVLPNPDHARDFDFNDISAIIRFSGVGFEVTSASNDVQYSPAPPAEREIADDAERGYALDVKPSEELVMMASSSAFLQNSIKIIEVPSREVLWQQDGTAPNTDKSPYQEGERGVYVIRNFSDRVQRIELYSRHQPDPNATTGQWRTSPYKVLAEGNASITVGFEDSPDDPSRLDWNDIRVHARWFSMEAPSAR